MYANILGAVNGAVAMTYSAAWYSARSAVCGGASNLRADRVCDVIPQII